MESSIRTLEASDREAVLTLLRSDKTFREDEVAVAMELVDDALDNPKSDYWVRVVEEPEGQLAGYICFGPTPMTQSTYDLYWIVVRSDTRGKGLAGRLVRAMEAELRQRGGGSVRVETSQTEGYGAARRLYQKLEYPEVARFGDFYRPGDDLIVYYKRL